MVDDALLKSFSEACGQTGPLRVNLDGVGWPGSVPIEVGQPFFIVGRGHQSDISIDSMDVSRRHAYFQVVAGRIFCVDLASRTGVLWGDEARPVGWIDRGRDVGIGPARVRIEGNLSGPDGEGGQLPISRSFEWDTLPEARLEFLKGATGRESWQVSRSLVLLGRSPVCRLNLPGQGVGGIHAALLRTPSGVWVVDLLEPGGILVRDEPARCALLEDGDELRIGEHRIRVRIGHAARPSAQSNLAKVSGTSKIRPASKRVKQPEEHGEAARSRLEVAGGIDPMTARLLEEFSRMHQSTTEQFQQALLMMFRMHQDQMKVIRDGLTRLDRLEEEQQSLQAELARIHQDRPPRLALRLVSGEPVADHPQSLGPAAEEAESVRPPAISPTVASSPTVQGSFDQAATSFQPGVDPHTRLARRIAEIQNERQGLWKKLFASLTGEHLEKGVL